MSLDYTFSIEPNSASDSRLVARFVDPATVLAIKGNAPTLAEYLESSGFSLRSAAGRVCTRQIDRASKIQTKIRVIERLSHNMAHFDTSDYRRDAFDINAFISHLEGIARGWAVHRSRFGSSLRGPVLLLALSFACPVLYLGLWQAGYLQHLFW